jgi:hypothetical protein
MRTPVLNPVVLVASILPLLNKVRDAPWPIETALRPVSVLIVPPK